MGKVAIIPENAPKGIINQALLKLTPLENILPEYLKLLMESNSFQQALNRTTMGVAIKNVASVKVLKELKIPLPSIEEQQRLIDKIDVIKNDIKTLRKQIELKESNINESISKVWTE
ncbi:conserved hypothetical protein [Tenacibaculum maritimum]|nr:restriction endonuclease subunit S [Tenacibaculum maritimum]CAA0154764.1 conserved hypothetical protein [Tenacibaculum maritimum]